MTLKITDPQLLLMARAYELRVHHGAGGVFPKSGQKKSLVILENLGLMRFAGYGRDIDGGRDNDVPIWEITEAGETELRWRGEIS